jgi:hypothetical protein
MIDPNADVTFVRYNVTTGEVTLTGNFTRRTLDHVILAEDTPDVTYLVGVPINVGMRYRVDLDTLELIELGAFSDGDS